jgi:hypothetical protein
MRERYQYRKGRTKGGRESLVVGGKGGRERDRKGGREREVKREVGGRGEEI